MWIRIIAKIKTMVRRTVFNDICFSPLSLRNALKTNKKAMIEIIIKTTVPIGLGMPSPGNKAWVITK